MAQIFADFWQTKLGEASPIEMIHVAEHIAQQKISAGFIIQQNWAICLLSSTLGKYVTNLWQFPFSLLD